MTNYERLTMVTRVIGAGHPAVEVVYGKRGIHIKYNGYIARVSSVTCKVDGDVEIIFDAVVNGNHWADEKIWALQAGDTVVVGYGSNEKEITVAEVRPPHGIERIQFWDVYFKEAGAGNHGMGYVRMTKGELVGRLR